MVIQLVVQYRKWTAVDPDGLAGCEVLILINLFGIFSAAARLGVTLMFKLLNEPSDEMMYSRDFSCK